MTREEAKKAADVMLAYADGKEIECRYHKSSVWEETDSPVWDFSDYFYRIKPQPTYRPFRNVEECWQEMQKHQPFGWVKDKDTQQRNYIGELDNDGLLTLCTQYTCSFEDAFEKFTFADGTPFGIKEEE